MAENLEQNVELQPEVSPIEEKAKSQGWVPEDQWEGDPAAWRPAKEFVDRGELFKVIDEVKRENKNLRQGLNELSRHHARVRETEYERALKDLKAQKKEALSEGDVDKVIEVDEEIAEVREAQRQAVVTEKTEPAQPDPRFTAWSQKNTWYKTERAMTAVADEVARDLVASGERDPTVILTEIDKVVRKEFPHKFVNPNRATAQSVEGSSSRGTSRKADTSSGMSDEERAVMNKILKVTPGLTKEKYLEEYNSYKGRV